MDPSKLAERLRGIVGGTGRPSATAAPAAVGPARGSNDAAAVLGGAWHAGAGGDCLIVDRRVDSRSVHGRATVGTFHSQLVDALASAVLLSGGQVASHPLLFFDLETTGLSGGAGTYAFLIGCAWFDEDGAFFTRQYVLTRLADERTVLRAFAGELARGGALVSFNGRTFDAPLLESRYLYHRLAWPAGDMPHLDMLHPARRFWGVMAPSGRDMRSNQHAQNNDRIVSSASSAFDAIAGRFTGGHPDPATGCSLGSLERRVLGVPRVGDVPGFEIPARYFQFVRSGDARPLAAVLEHNRLDLLSLAAVAARLLSLVHVGPTVVEHPAEALALGRVYARGGEEARADSAFREAVALAREDRESTWVAIEALRALARGARRRRQYEEAAEWWRALLRVEPCPRQAACEAHEALAVHHEHRLRDLESARSFALRILEEPARPAWADAVRHRLARIERKMGLLDL